jgi:hypothetical protein
VKYRSAFASLRRWAIERWSCECQWPPIQRVAHLITKEALENLGRPFEQVESQLTKGNKGSGLGLAIAKSLVELYGAVSQRNQREIESPLPQNRRMV